MNILEEFQRMHPDLTLVHDDDTHKMIHEIFPTWYMFWNNLRGKVETHDITAYKRWGLMTSDKANGLVYDDIRTYNSMVFDIEEMLAFGEMAQKTGAKFKRDMEASTRKENARNKIYGW